MIKINYAWILKFISEIYIRIKKLYFFQLKVKIEEKRQFLSSYAEL